jgi:hypothetical protein
MADSHRWVRPLSSASGRQSGTKHTTPSEAAARASGARTFHSRGPLPCQSSRTGEASNVDAGRYTSRRCPLAPYTSPVTTATSTVNTAGLVLHDVVARRAPGHPGRVRHGVRPGEECVCCGAAARRARCGR